MNPNDQENHRRRPSQLDNTEERRITRSLAALLATSESSGLQEEGQAPNGTGTGNQPREEIVLTESERSARSSSYITAQVTNSPTTTRMSDDENSTANTTVGPNVIHHVLQNNRDKLKIEVFDGRPGQDLDQWIKDYKMRTRNAGWNDAATKDGIPMYLGGKYKHWFEGKVVHVSDEKKKKYELQRKCSR